MATDSKSSDESIARKKIKDSKNCGLKKCFSALVDRKQVNLELEVLRLMLRKELQINLDCLDSELANILPYLLVYYIKNWPGWQKSVEYFSGNILFKAWYEKFHKFITLKLSEAIKTHYYDAINDFHKDKSSLTRKMYMLKKIADGNSQTDNLAPKVLAPFTIHIMAKPVLLNTIVFTDTNEGDVILKQHSVLEWDTTVTENITLKQIITWPHVGVHMYSPVFSFSRRNLHEFRRHVSLVGTPLPSTTVNFIEEIKIIDPKLIRNCYTLDYMKEMTSEFLKALGNLYKSTAMEAFQTVIDEFLADIEELQVLKDNKPTIASNTSILFNIGKHTYFRNKKLAKGFPSRNDLGYTEVVIPKMETALAYLADDDKIKSYLNHLKNFNNDSNKDNSNNAQNLPQITFSCSYCQNNFENGGLLATHLKEEHKMEQPMLCAQCKRSFPAFQLTKVRWNHTCNVQVKTKGKPEINFKNAKNMLK